MEQLDAHKKAKNHKKNEKQYLTDNSALEHSQLMSSMFQSIAADKNSQRLDHSDNEGDEGKESLL